MIDLENTLESLLKQNGYSMTKQRSIIFNMLVGQEPLTMNELIKMVKDKVDKVSVYRIISVFEQIGITQRLNIGWKYKIELTDKFAEHHHHLICLNCKKVIPINENSLEKFIEQIATQNKFSAQTHQVEVQGYCTQCQDKQTNI